MLEKQRQQNTTIRNHNNNYYYKKPPKDYDENDQDVDTETYPVNHPLIENGGGQVNGANGGGGGACDEETERTTLLGQSMSASRPGKLYLYVHHPCCFYSTLNVLSCVLVLPCSPILCHALSIS